MQVVPAAPLRLTLSSAAPSLPLPGGESTSVRRPEVNVPPPFTAVLQLGAGTILPVKVIATVLLAIDVQLSAVLVMKASEALAYWVSIGTASAVSCPPLAFGTRSRPKRNSAPESKAIPVPVPL